MLSVTTSSSHSTFLKCFCFLLWLSNDVLEGVSASVIQDGGASLNAPPRTIPWRETSEDELEPAAFGSNRTYRGRTCQYCEWGYHQKILQPHLGVFFSSYQQKVEVVAPPAPHIDDASTLISSIFPSGPPRSAPLSLFTSSGVKPTSPRFNPALDRSDNDFRERERPRARRGRRGTGGSRWTG